MNITASSNMKSLNKLKKALAHCSFSKPKLFCLFLTDHLLRSLSQPPALTASLRRITPNKTKSTLVIFPVLPDPPSVGKLDPVDILLGFRRLRTLQIPCWC